MYKTKYLCALLALSVYVGYYHLYRRSTQNSQFFRIGSRKVGSQLNTEQLFFLKYWDIQRRMRFDYEQLLEPCKNKMKWSAVYPERTFYMITSSRFSNATLHVKPVGQYSRLVIETFSVMNTRKNIGGDWWRVFVKGTSSSVHVTVLDRLDGTYEASFLILQPGKYEIDLYLEYTLCDGMKDPPEDFFSKGIDVSFSFSEQKLGYSFFEGSKTYLFLILIILCILNIASFGRFLRGLVSLFKEMTKEKDKINKPFQDIVRNHIWSKNINVIYHFVLNVDIAMYIKVK